ncbi:MAG: hutG 3 [Firmicutes bacterium]|nr:hutG 3 [Bacillota bacterium]
MKNKHLNLVFPQWQGGGKDLETYDGAMELCHNYLEGTELSVVDVSKAPMGSARNNIIDYDQILRQLKRARLLLDSEQPDTIFTVGGGCDADILSVSYLNARLEGDMTLVYFDAHGDIHTPESSETKRFYGMPVRVMLGEGDEAVVSLNYSTLNTSQLVMLGVRDLDKAEKVFIPSRNISVFGVCEAEQDIDAIIRTIRSKGHRNLYIHIDLDVLDPEEFPHTPLRVPGGMKMRTMMELLRILNDEFSIAGMGLFEYKPSGIKRIEILEYIISIGTNICSE